MWGVDVDAWERTSLRTLVDGFWHCQREYHTGAPTVSLATMTQYLCKLPKVGSRSPISYILDEMRQSMHSIFARRKARVIAPVNWGVKPVQEQLQLFIHLNHFFVRDFEGDGLWDHKNKPLQSSKCRCADSLKRQWKKISNEECAKFLCFESFDVYRNISGIPAD